MAMDWSDYPKRLQNVLQEWEETGGRVLFVDEGHGVACTVYTAYCAFVVAEGVGTIGICTADVMGGRPPVVHTVYISTLSAGKALEMIAGGQET